MCHTVGTVSSKQGIPSRSENYSEWYNELVVRAGMAEHSSVAGCMVIKPHGLLRRDPRMKERKKPGRPGARKRFQFSKR